MHIANGSSIDVFLPVLEFDRNQSITEYEFWVAEDGSTYWARVNEDGTHYGNAVSQSALYAMQYDEDGLACGAYDARLYRYGAKSMAQSPAIDRGTDDAYGYDSTSTNPKVIDMGQPDIGYHYYRRVADDDPITATNRKIEISFRQPEVAQDAEQISFYRVIDSDAEPGSSSYKIQDFEVINYPGQAVIDSEIVKGAEEKLAFPGKYNLEARSHTSEDNKSVPSPFLVIVDPDKPTIALE